MSPRFLWPLAVVLCACPPGDDSGDVVEYAGPRLAHEVPASPVEGTAITITATAKDSQGVAQVGLYYRVSGSSVWSAAPMTEDGDTWAGSIPAAAVVAPALEYYFKAADLGDPPATSYLPTTSTSAPFSLPVSVIGEGFPFYADFEPFDPEQPSLTDLGWGSANLTFHGYAWDLSTAHAHGGTSSAFHSRTVADIVPAPEDWLVSPPIDLTAAPTAQVTWYEYGVSPTKGTHALMISTGGSQPDSGDWVAVAELLPTAPDGEWGRSAAYDLSAYVGGVVYLAWAYKGADLDDWSIDDIAVTELQPDFTESFVVTPSPIQAGDSGSVSLTVTNTSSVEAADVAVTVTFPEGGASVTTETQNVGVLASGAAATAEFPLVVDATTPANSYLPITIGVVSGTTVFSEDGRLLVGQPSTASVEWLSLDDGALRLVVGVGDPEAPDWSTELVSTTVLSGTSVYTADITDAWAWLPAGPGDVRWFVEADSETGGAILDFSITYDSVTETSTMSPVAVDIAGSDLCYLPQPPEPALTRTVTSPTELDPGTSGATVSLTVTNRGAATAGPVIATLSSTHTDLTILDGGPYEIDSDPFEDGETLSLASLFVFDVASTHVDSGPVTADLTLTDGVESWILPVSLAVPFPVLRLTGITIDDDGGDAILDPDEYADLEFRITNVGDEATVGLVRGVLSVEATSTASAVAEDNSENVGTMSSGTTSLVDDFNVTVTGGAAGDTVDLLMTMTDTVRTYEARQQILLGEAPWIPMNDLGDDVGDAIEGADFDASAGWYRVVDGVLQMRLLSNTVFDPSRLFLEAWADSPSAEYGLYRIVAQSGLGALQGYDFTSGTFYDLEDPVVSYPDAYTVQLDASIASFVSLPFDELNLGWGIGWCGEPEYYCDQYPDGWGYPYVGYSTADWYTLEW